VLRLTWNFCRMVQYVFGSYRDSIWTWWRTSKLVSADESNKSKLLLWTIQVCRKNAGYIFADGCSQTILKRSIWHLSMNVSPWQTNLTDASLLRILSKLFAISGEEGMSLIIRLGINSQNWYEHCRLRLVQWIWHSVLDFGYPDLEGV